MSSTKVADEYAEIARRLREIGAGKTGAGASTTLTISLDPDQVAVGPITIAASSNPKLEDQQWYAAHAQSAVTKGSGGGSSGSATGNSVALVASGGGRGGSNAAKAPIDPRLVFHTEPKRFEIRRGADGDCNYYIDGVPVPRLAAVGWAKQMKAEYENLANALLASYPDACPRPSAGTVDGA